MEKPLALKLAPNSIDEVIGQKHLLGKGKVLRNLVENKKLFSMILYGPCGTGKTTLAYTIINELDLKYEFLNPVKQNEIHLAAAKKLLQKFDLPYYSIIIFSNKCKIPNITYKADNAYIIYFLDLDSRYLFTNMK